MISPARNRRSTSAASTSTVIKVPSGTLARPFRAPAYRYRGGPLLVTHVTRNTVTVTADLPMINQDDPIDLLPSPTRSLHP
ncbi:hypothetical protein FHR33_009857 [Nonomuraea dietziae]|uniref:Uncharacterized protein n=1 Tax=Nonomuraea dietziae TaxID=65515 RepID=A0A7W5VD56_9ACTN|nr:hypothetical protein [Nonomuraea dietziae]